MENILILTEAARDDWAYVEWKKNKIEAEIIFKKVNKPLRAIRRAWIKYQLPLTQIWYAKWKEQVKQADIIIVHMSYLTLALCEYLNILNPKARVIAWYWNCVDKTILPTNIRGNCEKWSFDIENCKDYHMRFNHQYYFKSFIKRTDKIIWDVYFCGSDVGRGEAIKQVYESCRKMNMKVKFSVVYPKSTNIPQEIISTRVSYDEIRKNIANSKAILELIRTGQSGATIRLMEAVFFGKKLITNNPYVKQEELYHEKNIFLLGERPIEELGDFLNSEFVPYDEKLLDQYDVRQWIQNFIDGRGIESE